MGYSMVVHSHLVPVPALSSDKGNLAWQLTWTIRNTPMAGALVGCLVDIGVARGHCGFCEQPYYGRQVNGGVWGR